MKTNLLGRLTATVMITLALGISATATAKDLTAFELIKEGNRYVGDDVKDQVFKITSDKSVGSMVPVVWYISYYDPNTTFHAVEVKFGAGTKLDVTRPSRPFEFGHTERRKLDRAKLKIDSDQALAIAIKDPQLVNLKLKASRFWLERQDEGPVWKVRLWAAKLSNPNEDADIGEVYILAEDGKVIRNDLHIKSVD